MRPRYAALAYLAITIGMTWPLTRGIGRDVPWDLGDSLLNMWILAWGAEQLKAILGGHFHHIITFFDANIFYPEPNTLAYSEHLFAQAVQMFPIYLLGRNTILCYNLLFIATFVLSGLGAFLLVRELTRHTAAAFLGGLLFAFALYRFPQAGHLQVISAQWMPFALYGFRRYFETGGRRALSGAVIALVAQNLSCGYYLLYFAPIVAGYVLWEITTRGLWRNRPLWTELAVAALVVIVCTLPFLLPYKQLRDSLKLGRDTAEVVRYSADVYSYATASGYNRTWGDTMRAFPKPEGELFPGIVPVALAVVAVVTWIAACYRREPVRPIAIVLAVLALAHIALAAYAILNRRVDFDVIGISIRAANITRLLVIGVACLAGALALAPRARERLAAALRRPEAIFLLILILAWWLSLGPSPRVYGRILELWAPYQILYDYVPGYVGLRVPARFGMIVALALAVLGGIGAAKLPRRPAGTLIIAVLGAAFLFESHSLPFPLNVAIPIRDYRLPEGRVYRPGLAPLVYQDLARVRPDAIVLEVPFNQPDYDVRAVYYSTAHWRKLVNGYSGFFPPNYTRFAAILAAFSRDPVAWQALQVSGITHVVVHEGAYLDDEGMRFGEWLRSNGAVEVSRHQADVLFELQR